VETFYKNHREPGSKGSNNTEAEEPSDIVSFVRHQLGFNPDEKQQLVLRGGRRGIVNCTRQWGKSTVTAAKAVHRAYSVAGTLTLVVTPSARQSGEFLRKAEEFVRKLGIKVRGDGDNEMSIAFPNGSRIVGLPGNEVTARGYSASLLLIDEAARVDDRLYRATRPVTGGGQWGSVADEYALWETRLLLGRVGTRRRGVGAYQCAGHGMRTDFAPVAGRGERQRRRQVPAGVHV
jgi:hypothetical protein